MRTPACSLRRAHRRRPSRGGRCGLLVNPAGAEQVRELEHDRDEVDRDQEEQEEFDVLLDGRVLLLDPLERRLTGEEVTVGLDRGDSGSRPARSPSRARRRSSSGQRRSSPRAPGRTRFSAASAAAARRRSRLQYGRNRSCASRSSRSPRLSQPARNLHSVDLLLQGSLPCLSRPISFCAAAIFAPYVVVISSSPAGCARSCRG